MFLHDWYWPSDELSDMRPCEVRPQHPGMLDADDLIVGRRVVLHCRRSADQLVEVVRRYHDDDRGYEVVELRHVERGYTEHLSLGDIGVAPYDAGWNATNYVTAADTEREAGL